MSEKITWKKIIPLFKLYEPETLRQLSARSRSREKCLLASSNLSKIIPLYMFS